MMVEIRGEAAPGLWVPGVAVIEADDGETGRLYAGPNVGWTRHPDAGGWVVDETFVIRAELTAALASALSVPLPESRIDPSRFPHLHRVAANAPLVAVGRIGPAGFPTVHVNHDPRGVWLRDFGIVGSVQGKPVRFGGMAFTLADGSSGAPGPWVDIDELPAAFIQRALVELTGGVVDLDAIGLALDLRDTTCEDDMESWELWLAEVLSHAAGMEAEAREIVRRIDAAGDADIIDVPRYGRAARLRMPRATLLAGESRAPEFRLELPETSRWIVERVKPWQPSRPWRKPAPPEPVIQGPSAFMPPLRGERPTPRGRGR